MPVVTIFGGSSLPCLLALPFHEVHPEYALRLILVMRAASQSEIIHSRLPASRERDNVIELDESATPATAPGDADKGAATFVALPDRTSDRGGNVPGHLVGVRATLATQLASADAQPAHLELRDQRVQG